MSRSAKKPLAWVTLADFEPDEDDFFQALANSFIGYLEFCNSKNLLTRSGKKRAATHTRAAAKRLGLYRRDFNARGARFLDYCESWRLQDGLLFECYSQVDGYPRRLENLWGIWTGEKYENQKAQFLELLKGDNDNELCDHVALILEQKPQLFVTHKTRSQELQVVSLVWGAYGLIGNGGFEYFFSSDCLELHSLKFFRQAFEVIKCKQALLAFDRALTCFPNGKPSKTPSGRERTYKKAPQKTRDSINKQFFKTGWNGALAHALATYIRQRPEVFQIEPPKPLMNQK